MSTADFLGKAHTLLQLRPKTPFRENAWARFLELGLPDKAWEPFRYVPLQKIYDFAPAPIEATPHFLSEFRLVFVEGNFQPSLSSLPQGLVILPLHEALKTYGPVLQTRLNKTLKEETDPFALLNLALHDDALFCYLPPKLQIEKPLHIVYLGKGAYAPSHLTLFCSSGSSLSTLATTSSFGFHHTSMDVALEEGAHFSHTEASMHSGIHLSDFKATLKKQSSLKHFSATAHDGISRSRLHIALLGEEADALLQGLSNSRSAHTHVYVRHVAPHARSLQKYKNILKGSAQSSFAGNIYVEKEAQKTEAYQLNHNLLIGESAIAYAQPNLEIFADDVKASHGATTAQLDEEHLFYLTSRGLSRETAHNLLIQGFIQEMLDAISHRPLRELVASHVF